jgi:putative nucleotidyltransferase with HDIG domain
VQIVLDTRTILMQIGLDSLQYEEWIKNENKRLEMSSVEPEPVTINNWIGKMVKHDVVSSKGLLLIPAYTTLTRGHLKLLQQHYVPFSDITVVADTDLCPSSSLVMEATRFTEDLFVQIRSTNKVPILDIRSELIPYIQQISEHDDLFQIVESVKAVDSYTYKHSVGVGVLATLIGKWMQLDPKELSLLSMAATLHDIGKMRIPQEILHKKGALTEKEFKEMKRHTVYGYDMLRDTPGLNHRIALVALQHHERSDGKGYPLGMQHPQIDRLSSIVAVADMFHAMISNRPYKGALPFHEVIEQLHQGKFNGLDPYIVNIFIRNIYTHLIGRKVELTDGRLGEVVYINPHEQLKPLLRIRHSFLDLTQERELAIRSIIA